MNRFLIAIASLICAACARNEVPATDSTASTAATKAAPATIPTIPAAVPANVSANQFATLRFLYGSWRGNDESGKPFFEGYRAMNDSTIRTYGYPDSITKAPGDSGTVELRGGRVYTGSDGKRWVVDSISDGYVRFAPMDGVRNTFRWERMSDDQWMATLEYPANAQRPARRVVYHMQRMKR